MSAAPQRPKPEKTEVDFRRGGRPPQELTPAAKQWLEENAEAIKSWNDWVAEHGLPLEEYRMF